MPGSTGGSHLLSNHRRAVRTAAWAGGSLIVVVLLRSAWLSGLNPDQVIDQQYFINNLAEIIGPERFGRYTFFEGSDRIEASYGYTFQSLAFALSWGWHTFSGQEFDPFSASVLSARNVLVTLVALTVLPSVYLIGRTVSGRRWVGWTSIAAVALLPTLTGHALINQKDIPFTAGFTAVTAAAVIFLKRVLEPPDPQHDRRVLLLTPNQWGLAALLAFGICMTVGTRPPSAVAVGVTIAATTVVAVLQRHRLDRSDVMWACLGLLVGGVIVLVTNAAATPNPVGWILDSISVAGDFPGWRARQLINGEYLLPEQLPRTHIISMIAAQTPVVMLLLGAVGVAGIARDVAMPGPLRRSALLWLPVAIQLGLLPVAGILQGSLFYNVSRQVLFVYPMIAVLAAWGVFTLTTWFPAGRLRVAALATVALLAVLPAVDTLTLWPYQYVYFNEVTRGDLTNRYELDYWGISGRETQRWVNENFPNAIEQYPTGWELERYAGPGIDIVDEFPAQSDRPLLWAGNWYPSWGIPDYPQCPVIHEVTRNLWGEGLRLGYVRRCPS